MRIIVILLSLTALLLAGCQGNRLSGSASSFVATEVSGFLPCVAKARFDGYASPSGIAAPRRQ